MWTGSIVALVTPMKLDGSIDMKALHDLVEWHLSAKTDGFVIAGTTGESATLTSQEQFDIISVVVKQVNKRVPVVAGTGSNSTQHTIELTQQAKKAGADGVLIVTPYYNKPTQHGLYEHYKMISEHVTLPVILYNVPGRTGCDMLPQTVHRISKLPHMVGIKEATGKLERAQEISHLCSKDFAIYSGDDETAVELMLNANAKGVISVTANVAPHQMHQMCAAALTSNKELAHKLNNEIATLHKTLFVESNPIPVKWALHKMGLIPPGIRLPLLPLDTQYHAQLTKALQEAGAVK